MRRRLVHFSMGGLVVLLVAVATLPWWLGAALSSVGGRYGLSFDSYARAGYGRFVLHGLKFSSGRTEVAVTTAEADTPVLWLWRRQSGSTSEVRLGDWSVNVAPARAVASASVLTSASPSRGGWMPLRGTLRRIAAVLERWMPDARSQSGVVRWQGGQLKLAGASWSDRSLQVQRLAYRGLDVDGSLQVPADVDRLRLMVRANDGSYAAQLTSEAERVTGSVEAWKQPAIVQAEYASEGWLPRQALLQADDWVIPAERLKLDSAFRDVRGRMRLEWTGDRFTAELNARGEPLPARAQIPVLNASVQAHGDFATVTIDRVEIIAPGVTARLSEPVAIGRDGAFRAGTASFHFDADLASQPWFEATGQIKGDARLGSVGVGGAVVDFQVQGERLAARGVEIATVEARGRWESPRVTIEAGTLAGATGDRIEWKGGWDVRTRELIAAELSGTVRQRTLARWLPARFGFEELSVRATASGGFAELQHEGAATATKLVFPAIKPLDGTLSWQGRALELSKFDLHLAAGRTGLAAGGSASRSGVRLTHLEFSPDGVETLRLTEPAQFRWETGLQLESLRLAGSSSSLDAAGNWGPTGRVEVAARGIPSSWLRDLLTLPDVGWELKLLAVSGSWDRGPMSFTASASGEMSFGKEHRVAVMTALRGGASGLTVEALRATESNATVLNASGVLPLTLRPGSGALVAIDSDGPVSFKAVAAPHAQFWAQLAAFSGVELKEPDGEVTVSGTWSRPEGKLSLKASRVAVDATRFKRPPPLLEGLDVLLIGNRDGARLDHLAVTVEGQPLRAAGSFVVPAAGWGAVRAAPLELAKVGAEFQIELPSTEVAAFSRFLPGFVAPTGRLELKVNYRRGEFDGFVRLHDAASRPLGPLGVLQEISADAQLQGRRFVLREVTAKSGGQPVKLTGSIEIPLWGLPRYDLALQGENLPFARQAGLLLRGDVDLKLRSPTTGDPKLTGTVRLRDSLFLADVRSFVPSGAQTAARRPPYFAITAPPMGTWPIDVEVTGRQFLRVRTPVFTGVASANFRLSGTLGEPRAIGDAKLDEGHVMMPFASFELQQGVVRLTEMNPYEPTLFVRGTGRRFGYNLTLEVDGSASAPNVVLSSSPALDSEQVLLMVMTGAPPTDEINISATQRVTRIGTFLGQTLLGSLGGDGTNADRLSIATGEKISRQGKETYEIEYKLSDRLTLVGEYNEFDEQNAGLKWRIFPRRRAQPEGEGEAK